MGMQQCKYKVFFLDMFVGPWLIQQGVAEILFYFCCYSCCFFSRQLLSFQLQQKLIIVGV